MQLLFLSNLSILFIEFYVSSSSLKPNREIITVGIFCICFIKLYSNTLFYISSDNHSLYTICRSVIYDWYFDNIFSKSLSKSASKWSQYITWFKILLIILFDFNINFDYGDLSIQFYTLINKWQMDSEIEPFFLWTNGTTF